MFESKITLPRIRKLQEQGNTAQYEVAPLEPGYGVTIGQALQRVLRSSLPGAAVTSVRIEGVQYEDQKLPGVREDVGEIVLNIKQVRLRCFSDHPVSMKLNVSGAREVIAADIVVPSTIEIINPEAHLATIEGEHACLTLELLAQRGRGYALAEEHLEQSSPLGMIPIDAIYTPVRKVSYGLEHARVGKMVNFDKILLDIETNGSIPPDEALRQGAAILMQQFLVFTHTTEPASERERPSTASTVMIPQHVYNLPLDILNLSVRSYNSFKRSGITNVGQILAMDEEDLRGIRNIGDKSIPQIVDALRIAGCFPSSLEDIQLSE